MIQYNTGDFMNKLQKRRKEVLIRLEKFQNLQKCSNVDFPNNYKYLYENNLKFYHEYYTKCVLKPNYRIKLDTILVTHIINYLSSVKSYLNRKKKSIETLDIKYYKNNILKIIEKYWTPKHEILTKIDLLINIRDEFEHSKIDSISLKSIISENEWKKIVMYKEVDLNQLFIDTCAELDRMNKEIENFIAREQEILNLRDCVLFMNAFEKRFNNGTYTIIAPEPTEEEIKQYDLEIEKLLK